MTQIALEKSFHFEVEEPSDFGKEVALKELRETPENVLTALKRLKYLLENETTVCLGKDNEKWLMNLLRLCKFYPESAKEKIVLRLELKKKYSNFLNNSQITELKNPKNKGMFCVLKQRDHLGRRVVIQRIENWKPSEVDKYELFRIYDAIANTLRLEPDTQINGVIHIMDFKNVNFSQILQMTPNFVKILAVYIFEYVPLRVKAYHIINNPISVKPVIQLGKQLLSAKNRERILVHGKDMRELHRYISVDCLPKCYGGLADDIELDPSELFDIAKTRETEFNTFQECESIGD
uniref:CRAL-TRIO domain-containing protein n=1 Tax=Glossina brevipalpis TaxID=37001 RepID=A0A1A9X070_9MUSC